MKRLHAIDWWEHTKVVAVFVSLAGLQWFKNDTIWMLAGTIAFCSDRSR